MLSYEHIIAMLLVITLSILLCVQSTEQYVKSKGVFWLVMTATSGSLIGANVMLFVLLILGDT